MESPNSREGNWHYRKAGLHSDITLDNLLPHHGPQFPLLQRVRSQSLWVPIAYSRILFWCLIVNIMGHCLDKYFSRKHFYHYPQ